MIAHVQTHLYSMETNQANDNSQVKLMLLLTSKYIDKDS